MAFSFPHYPQNHTTDLMFGGFLPCPLCAIFELIYNHHPHFVAKCIQKDPICLKDKCYHSVESIYPLAENGRL